MKKLKFKYITSLVLGLSVSLTSCDFGDINDDPGNPSEVTMPALMASSQGVMAYVLGSEVSRYNGMFTQHVTGIARQNLLITRYSLLESDIDGVWRFGLYGQALNDLNTIINLSAEQESPHYAGVSKVLMANGLGVITDLWGDVPYSEAFKGIENLRPSYDKQEDVYASIHKLLDEAIVDLNKAENKVDLGGDDFIYGGDVSLWLKAAYSLKARYYNHLSNLPGQEQSSATSALTALQNGFSSNSESMKFVFGSSATSANPWFQFADQRNGDVVMCAFFVDLMNNLNDPRLPLFVDSNENGNYVGIKAGLDTVSVPADGSPSEMGPFYASTNSPVPFITYVEAKFIEAEANLRAGNPLEAANAHNAAVIASLNEVTGTADAAYVTANASENAATITLEKIMTQKYIALFTNSETFTDFRRTGFPSLSPAENHENTVDQILVRWPYPSSERLLNPNSTKVDDPLNTPVWWDK